MASEDTLQVVIRADASLQIGTGHIMRCLSLADELNRRGAAISFICCNLEGHLAEYIKTRGYKVDLLEAQAIGCSLHEDGEHLTMAWREDADNTYALISEFNGKPDWLIVDHYALDKRWEERVHVAVIRTMVIDDLANREHICDVLIDQNFYANANSRYAHKLPPHCRQLIGPSYALLRNEFLEKRSAIAERPGVVRQLLVMFGGSDRENLTAVAIAALAQLNLQEVAVDVAISDQHRHAEEIRTKCMTHGFHLHVQSERLAELMANADLAIGAGGSTTWERCCLGLPCITFAVAENQRQVVAESADARIIYAPDADPADEDKLAQYVRECMDNPKLLNEISKNALSVVDGRGCSRVSRVMGAFSVAVREATHDDCKNVFEWRNDTIVRESSLNASRLSWASHRKWFGDMLLNSNQVVLIGEYADMPVGVVRFDIESGTTKVSIYMLRCESQRGFGSELLLSAESWLSENRPRVKELRAVVLEKNKRSQSLFSNNGYRASGTIFRKAIST